MSLYLLQWLGYAGTCGLVCFFAYRLGRKQEQISLHKRELQGLKVQKKAAEDALVRPKRSTTDLLERMRGGKL